MKGSEVPTLSRRRLYHPKCCVNCLGSYMVKMIAEDGNYVLEHFCVCDLCYKGKARKAYDTLERELSARRVEDTNYSDELCKLLKISPGQSYKESPRYMRYSESLVCQYYDTLRSEEK